MHKLFGRIGSVAGIVGAAVVALAIGTQLGVVSDGIGDQAANCVGLVALTGCAVATPTATPRPAAPQAVFSARLTTADSEWPIYQSIPNLSTIGKDNQIISAQSEGGVEVAAFAEPNYKGECVSARDGRTATLPVDASGQPATSSVLLVPSGEGSGTACVGLVLYDEPNYAGASVFVRYAATIPDSFYKKASSIRHLGRWSIPVFAGYGQTGTCMGVSGDVPNLGALAIGDNTLMSVGWTACPDPATPARVNVPTTDNLGDSDPAAIRFDGATHVFARHADNTLWHRGNLSASVSAETMGGSITHGPAVASWGPGRLDAFARGADGALYQMWFDGTWHEWARLTASNTIHSDPVAVSWGPNRIDVFARSATGGIVQVYWDGSAWHEYHGLADGRTIPYGLGVSSRGPGKLDLFYRGSDNAVYHRVYDGGWQQWTKVSGTGLAIVASDPDVVSYDSNHLDLFARATNGQLVQFWWDNNGWRGPVYLGGNLSSGVAVSARAPGVLDVFARGSDGRLMRKSQESGNRWQEWTAAIQ